ncbi:hypothetical protein DYB37_005407, partial [Aphanomyces astaci]
VALDVAAEAEVVDVTVVAVADAASAVAVAAEVVVPPAVVVASAAMADVTVVAVESVYGEKRISVDVPAASGEGTEKVEYRVWNPFRSKLAAAILGGVDNIWMGPGSKVLYIGGACIDSTAPAEAVFAREVKKLQQDQFKPAEQLTLEPYERDHAVVVGNYRAPKKDK